MNNLFISLKRTLFLFFIVLLEKLLELYMIIALEFRNFLTLLVELNCWIVFNFSAFMACIFALLLVVTLFEYNIIKLLWKCFVIGREFLAWRTPWCGEVNSNYLITSLSETFIKSVLISEPFKWRNRICIALYFWLCWWLWWLFWWWCVHGWFLRLLC